MNNTKDLIERQAALDCFHDWIDKHGDVHTADEMPEYRAIEELPSVQSEIIHCRDCKHCYTGWDDRDNQYYSCTVKFDKQGFWNEVMSNDFCSWAGRRTDE